MTWRSSFSSPLLAGLILSVTLTGAAARTDAAADPDACFEVTGKTGLTVEVDGSCSSDPDPGGQIVSWRWEWNDGTSAEGPQASHTYTRCPRIRPVIALTVVDTQGEAATLERRVELVSPDRDGDGLPACREREQSTSDRRKDADGDGLSDLVESVWWRLRDRVFCGRRCAYPDPVAPDIYVEIDHMRRPDGHAHSHRMPRSLIRAMTDDFTSHGMALHIDHGAHGGGNPIAHADDFTFDASTSDHADRYYNDKKGDGFARFRRGIFHYVVIAHRLAGDPSCRIVGLGEAPRPGPKRFGDFVVIFRACIDGRGDPSAGLIHVFLQELGHNLFDVIEPASDAYPCPSSDGIDPYHDRYQGYAMWPFLGGGGPTFHPNRWETDMAGMGLSIRKKLGSKLSVNKRFSFGHAPC